MEIDYSKENIQPLRGGRNVSQLETALQAQSDTESQRELLQQKGVFEEKIQAYVGEDPLDNWYNYISWVEQSYPKHGHEGNLVALLEDCVAKFENDARYRNDRRMCKLWIKYIDLQQNPLELFPCLHNKGICVFCADLYKAWAYYHEAAGDFKRAEAVFKMGLSVFAQPYGELVAARDNMHLTFVKQTLEDVDVDERLAETRHALTSLRSYKENHSTVVPSVRNEHQIIQPTPGTLPMMAPVADQLRISRSNVSVTPYEDLEVAGPSIGAAAASTNILDIARKQAFIQKENTLKPGTWKQNIVSKKTPQHRDPSFKVHEDEDPQYAGGIRLLPDHYPMNHDDFSEWKTDLFFNLEPHDPRQVPMYPKHLVYAEQEIEYSPEEIRARKYAPKKRQPQSMELSDLPKNMMEEVNCLNAETDYAVQSIQPSVGVDEHQQVINWTGATISCDAGDFTDNMREAMKDINEIWKDNLSTLHHQEPSVAIEVKTPEMVAFQIHEDTKLDLPDETPFLPRKSVAPFQIHEDKLNLPDESGPSTSFLPRKSAMKLTLQIPEDNVEIENKPVDRFSIYEEGSAGSSNHIHETTRISQGLRQSMIPPFISKTPVSQPEMFEKFARPAEVVNNKKIPFPVFEDEPPETPVALDDSCTTQTFNFNLNSASTPFNMKKIVHHIQPEQQPNNVEATRQGNNKKILFDETEKLSTIFENSKESRNSSCSLSSGGITTLKTTFYRESLKVIPEMSSAEASTSEQTTNYHFPSQTTTADNHLKQQKPSVNKEGFCCYDFIKMLLNDSEDARDTNYESPMKNQFKAMSCDSNGDSSPVKSVSKMDVDCHNLIPNNLVYKMDHETHESIEIDHPAKSRLSLEDEQILSQPVTDPFSSRLNNALLNKMNFPSSKYSAHFYEVQSLPRLIGKKETVCFLQEKYVVSKLIGKGAFASVYKAEHVLTNEMVALKYEKPANRWEYYIVQEIRERLSNPYLLQAYMEVSACYISKTASVLVSEYCKFGSLLDLINRVKQNTGKGLKELVAIYYANEIITIVNALHQCKIIHGNIKPDNFLITRMPPVFGYPSLKLIDFGSSIDMSLFPAGTSFKKPVNTENFICTEMKDGREWTYQTDIFCIAATIHVLLFDKYMKVQKSGKVWAISQHIPCYMRTDLWKPFFFQMLNIDSCSNLPDLAALKDSFQSIISFPASKSWLLFAGTPSASRAT